MATEFLERPGLPRLAYNRLEAVEKSLPTVIFLGGFRSDMEGTKALYLEKECRARGQGFVRFDYSGHGKSEGRFEDGTIGGWKSDALAVFDRLTDGPAIVAGSSMGGWIALLLALARPERIRGVIGIAAAPDFTRHIHGELGAEGRHALEERGWVEMPTDYDPQPYRLTRALFADGENHCLLDRENRLDTRLRLIQGMKDTDVPWQTAHRIKNAFPRSDVEVFLIENGDHRLSRPEDLVLIGGQVQDLSESA